MKSFPHKAMPSQNPEDYSWEACRLTRHMMMEGRSHSMQECLTRLAIWHMKGDKDCKTGYEIAPGIALVVERRCDPPPGYSSFESVLKRLKDPMWVDGEEHPPREIQFTSRIEGPVKDPIEGPAWDFDATRVNINEIPESIAQKIISFAMKPVDIIQHPFLASKEIQTVEWGGLRWTKRGKSEETPFPGGPNRIRINLKGGMEFRPITVTV